MRIHHSVFNSVVTNQSYKKRKICEVFERRDILPQPLHREYLLYKKKDNERSLIFDSIKWLTTLC